MPEPPDEGALPAAEAEDAQKLVHDLSENAIKLLTGKVADAVLEGRALRKDLEEETAAEMVAEAEEKPEAVMADEELLGEAPLAKLQTGAFGESDAAVGEDSAIEGEGKEEASA
mgnify:CR=1 FL=1